MSGHRPIVTTTSGALVGVAQNGARAFRGIPYADAPIGELRFAPPAAAPTWHGERDASRVGAASLQNVDPLSMVMPGAEHYYYRPADATFSEDCLTLNVWTPSGAQHGELPVLVWIHGGGFLTGSGGSDWFDGSRLARRENIVVVTINYRLGILGNLWLGDYDPAATNAGTRDQIAALRWVQNEIAAFGGNPENVTVWGQSAGGISVATLMVAPHAEGLFHRAIVQSGHLELVRTVDGARDVTARVLAALEIRPDADVLSELRQVSTIRLLEVQRGLGIGSIAPVVDGSVLPTDPLRALEDGASSTVPLLIGNVDTENGLFRLTGLPGLPAGAALRDAVSALAGAEVDDALVDAAVDEYRADATDDAEAFDRATSDVGWIKPTSALLHARASAAAPTYLYAFAWRSPALDGAVGAAHEVEVPFVFDALDAPGVSALLGEPTEDARALAAAASSAWVAFARDGSPQTPLLPPWPPTTESANTMVLDVSPALVENRHAARAALWAASSATNPLLPPS
jgi:para-nitrobenzyl esterase